MASLILAVLTTTLATTLVQSQFAPTCPSTCQYKSKTTGKTFDLSALQGTTLSHTDEGSGSKYTLTLCGTTATQCPNDISHVTQGMAVQTQSGDQCFVLAVYGDEQSCDWTENTQTSSGSTAPLTLAMSDGTPTYCGSPRTLTVNFMCPADQSTLVPTDFTASNPEGTCDYIYTVSTCAVCMGGCQAGGSFGDHFCVFFFVGLAVYLLGGVVFNFHQGKRGVDLVSNLWPSVFVGYAKDGFAFAMGGCKNGVGGGNKSSGGLVAGATSAATPMKGDSYQPYQNI